MRTLNRRAIVTSALCLGIWAAPLAARANGAFPDEFSIHFPASAAHRILVGANFGLLVSEDDGATWRYSCEPYVTSGSSAALSTANVSFYQVTADGAVLAQSTNLTRSTDVGCSWPTSGGAVAGASVQDTFADPTDPALVFAILLDASGTSITISHDGGVTFGPAAYKTTALLTGVESSRSAPKTIYATQISLDGSTATLLRSTDQGKSWTALNMALGVHTQPRILAVDPESSSTVFLRLLTGTTDSIAVTTDGGATFQNLLTVKGAFTSFLRAGDGALYAGMSDGSLYVRAAGQAAFVQKAAGPHLRCLGQRPGSTRIFACGSSVLDGFSVGYSDDGAQTFHPLMSFKDLLGPLTCPAVQTACSAHWARVQMVLGIGAVADAGTPDAGTTSPPHKSGCNSAASDGLGPFTFLAMVLKSRRSSRQRLQ
jgi:photosystem II stability/assembly factor-like uncharacterized protein